MQSAPRFLRVSTTHSYLGIAFAVARERATGNLTKLKHHHVSALWWASHGFVQPFVPGP